MKLKVLLLLLFLFTSRISSQWVIQQTGVTEMLRSVHFVNPSTGFAVGLSGRIITTTNGGVNWTVRPNSFGNAFFGVYFVNPDTGFIAGEGLIVKTVNGGVNLEWQPAPVLFTIVFPGDSSVGYTCGTNGSVLKTTNYGTNWTTLTTGLTTSIWDISFININTGIGTSNNGAVIKTTNAGTSWVQYQTGSAENLYSVCLVNENLAFAGSENGLLYKTTNGGVNWAQLNSTVVYKITDIFFCNQNTGTFVTMSGKIRRTTNAGANWIEQPSPSTYDSYAVQFFGTDTGFVAADVGRILKTTTGGFPPAGIPNLVSPLNNALNVSITPLMKWDTAAYSQSYNLQIASDSAFSSIVFDTTGIINIQHPIRSGLLNNNINYYWRVRGFNNLGFGGWSSVWKFRTIVALPLSPALLLPVNEATNVALSPFFDWDSTSPATYYRLQLSFDSSFSAADPDINGITSSFLQLTSTLRNNALYFWRVCTTNEAGTGPWSLPNKFSTVISFPPPPLLVIPLQGAQNVSLTPLLDWRDDVSALNYRLQVSADSTFGSTVVDNNSITTSQFTVPVGILNDFTKYYWRVNTTNSLGTSNWSAVWNFTTILSVPAAPVLLEPFNSAENISLIPLLNWDDNPFSTYRVQLAKDSIFSAPNMVINISGLNVSQYQVQGGSLINNTTYYWRVNATNTAGTGDWSVVWHFRTIVSAPVAPPILLAPLNNATGVLLAPTLDWTDVFSAEKYVVQITTDSTFSSTPLIDTTSVLSQLLVPQNKLSALTKYYWRVRAQNVGGISPWSDKWNFTTGNAIGLQQLSSRIPLEFKLYNNYPNPFNPVTKIRFDLPKPDKVKIEVYDMLGQLIDEIINEDLTAGEYAVSWNASSFASGVYIYRIITSKNVDVKKMVVVK